MKTQALILSWIPDGLLQKLGGEFAGVEFIDALKTNTLERHLPTATITYGAPPIAKLEEASGLRWIQLTSAGVPRDLCPVAARRAITVTNLAGLYGASIAEHALGVMIMLARNLQIAVGNQQHARWDREIARTMTDLHGRTVAIIGLGNIGRGVARLARAYGMRVLGCRRTDQPVPFVDRIYPCAEMHALLGEADYVVVAAPLTSHTDGMLGPAEFRAMKRGAIYINVSRGPIAQERALLDALRSGHVAAAGMDVFAVEPLPPAHPLWSLPQVVISPHYSGETINQSSLPAERFARNLHAWLTKGKMEGVVDLQWGY